VAYLLDQFPSVSETFILREMAQLERRGVRILPCALVRPEVGAPIHQEAEAFLARTVYRPARPQVGDWLRACVRWPKGGASGTVLAIAHSLRRPGHAREMAGSLAAASHFAPAIQAAGVQHLHAQFGSMPATIGLMLAEITGLSLSLSLHARDIFTDESILLRQKLLESEFATTCTKFARDRLLATQPAALHGRLHLVRHGIDITRTTRTHRPAREPIITIVGRLVEKKGHRVLLRAMQMLRRRRTDLMLAVAGDGPLRGELESLAESLGIAPLVNFCGTLAQEQIEELLAASRVLVAPSVVAADGDRDGLPNVILEAALIGTPIVASEVSAIPEFVVNRETGLLVPPDEPRRLADAISAVLEDPAAAHHRAEEARRRVTAEYDISRNVQALEALLRETVTRREEAPARRRSADQP
jgi:glycosyltransferase involved in cell wall biosynthesis